MPLVKRAVDGPVSAVQDNIVIFDDSTGKKLKDSGKALSDYVEEGDARLTDARDPTAHALDAHTAVTLAELNAKISDKNIASTDAATTSAAGLVELATDAEVQSGGDATRGVTPAALKAYTGWRPSGMKNLLINGNFDIWQRGTSFSGNGYTADRWNHSVGGSGGTQSVSSESLNNIRFLRLNRSAAGTSFSDFLAQYIEFNPFLFAKTCTLSFKAKGTDGKNLRALAAIHYGSGGASNEMGLSEIFSLTGGWERYSFTFTFPSGEGKSIGTNPFFYITFRESSGFSTFVLDLSEVQLELGSVATPFEQRPIGLEMSLCRRYFQFRSTGDVNALDLSPQMRATPTITGSASPFSYSAEL